MATLGELVIELGVVGDAKPLEAAISKMKEAVKVVDDEIKANQRLLKYLQDVNAARNDSEKKLIKENFANEIKKQKMLDEIDANQKAVEGKKQLATNIGKVVKGATVLVGALIGAAIAINKLTDDLVRNNQAMLDLTRTTDIAQSTFQKWGGIGKMLGIENADQQLASLNERLFELRLTGEGARGFQLAGINPMGQDANGVLEQLRSRVKGMNDTTATYLLKQMGLDPRMLHLLRMEREEFEELGRTIKRYQLTPQQTKQIQEMNIQLQIAGIKLRYLRDRAVLALMPYWVKFMQSLARVAEMLVKAGREAGKFVAKWRGLIGVFVFGLSRIKAVQTFFESTNGSVAALITKIPILGRAFAALGGIFARTLLPLTAWYLLLDDIAVYMQGGNSLIGEVIEWTKTTGGEIGDAFKKMFGGDVFGGINDLEQTLIDIVKDISLVLTRILDILLGTNITKGTKENFKFLDSLFTVKNEDEFKKLMENASPLIKRLYDASPKFGLSDASSMYPTPVMQRNVSSSTTNQDNRISMNNYIQTSQPVADIERQILNAQFRQNASVLA